MEHHNGAPADHNRPRPPHFYSISSAARTSSASSTCRPSEVRLSLQKKAPPTGKGDSPGLGGARPVNPPCPDRAPHRGTGSSHTSLLQLPLQKFDLLRQCGVGM